MFSGVFLMNRQKSNENIIKIVDIDEKIKRLQFEISRLERERVRLDKARLNEMYEEEQTIWTYAEFAVKFTIRKYKSHSTIYGFNFSFIASSMFFSSWEVM